MTIFTYEWSAGFDTGTEQLVSSNQLPQVDEMEQRYDVLKASALVACTARSHPASICVCWPSSPGSYQGTEGTTRLGNQLTTRVLVGHIACCFIQILG